MEGFPSIDGSARVNYALEGKRRMNTTRIERLLKLIHSLQSGRARTADTY